MYGNVPYKLDVSAHARHLDAALQAHIGVSYLEAIEILQRLQIGVRPAVDKDSFPSIFVLQEAVMEKFAKAFNKPVESIMKMLAGFRLMKEDLIAEGRAFWNPNFHYRAYRRGMFLWPHELGPHLAWSKYLYSEGLTTLLAEVCFGHFPKEWRSPSVDSKLGDIARENGQWFEMQVQKKLSEIGINGLASRTALGLGRYAMSIPAGELDFIGWCASTKSLVLLECKILQDGTEPRMWKNHFADFMGSKKEEGFIAKLARKAKWASENSELICEALRSEGIQIADHPVAIHSGFITYAPNAVSYFIDGFPCVSLPEFLADYKGDGTWPYDTGILQVNMPA